MTIYFISGLGADKRIFQKLQFTLDYELVYLDWITPGKDEPAEAYTRRLTREIDTKKPFCLVGLSFGGMLVTECLKFLKPEKAIIISSFTTNDFRPLVKFARWSGLYKIAPYTILKRPNAFTSRIFGARTKEEKKLLRSIMNDTSTHFLRWSIRQILLWKNEIRNKNIYHIHGDNDRVIPVRYVDPDYIVKGGEHLMIYSHAPEISKVIRAHLDDPDIRTF